jgi:hypothetical protein
MPRSLAAVTFAVDASRRYRMLREVLLVLAGHESSVVVEDPPSLAKELLHPSEAALMAQVAVFGKLHKQISRRINIIQSSYMDLPSSELEHATSYLKGPYLAASQAVANVLEKDLLSAFRMHLIEIEKLILSRDSAYVGGNNVVSLTVVVSRTIREWERLFMYSNSLLGYIMDGKQQPAGHDLITRLQREALTGYNDVKTLVEKCLASVERSWLAQIESWLVFGRLPGGEFMIDRNENKFHLVNSRIPPCIDKKLAQEIYVTGNCLRQMKTRDLATIRHLDELLKSTELPIRQDQFKGVVDRIRASVLKNVTATVLHVQRVEQLFTLFRRILLIGSLEFADAFLGISQAATDFDPVQLLRRSLSTFAEDAVLQSDRDLLNLALGALSYNQITESEKRPGTVLFDDLLFNVRCRMDVALDWPFNILVSSGDADGYGVLFTYLMSIRAATCRLGDLWRGRRMSEVAPQIWVTATKAKVFLEILWHHFQSLVIEVNFSALNRMLKEQHEMGQMDPQEVESVHKLALNNILRELFISDMEVQNMLRQLCVASFLLCEMVNGTAYVEADAINDIPILIEGLIQHWSKKEDSSAELNHLLVKLEGS